VSAHDDAKPSAVQLGGMLTIAEQNAVIAAVRAGLAPGSSVDATEALEWAEMARAEATMLDLVLDGKVAIRLPEESGGEMRFVITAEGERVVKDLLASGGASPSPLSPTEGR